MPTSPTQGIGVLSSISFNGTALANAFRRGVGREIYMNVKDNRGYAAKSLNEALQALNNDVKLGLIATAGGLIVAQEAAKETGATLPFISLVGGTPGAFPSLGQGYFRGGVSLESFAQNPHRIAHLVKAGIPENKICLLSNPNSFMAKAETAAWTAGRRGPVVLAGGAKKGSANTTASYQTAFAKIAKAGMMGVVVSADPFFKETMDALIDAANKWIAQGKGRRICYPLNDYENAAGKRKPAPGHTLYGPSLEDAYEQLGRMAANFLVGQPIGLQMAGLSAPRDR